MMRYLPYRAGDWVLHRLRTGRLVRAVVQQVQGRNDQPVSALLHFPSDPNVRRWVRVEDIYSRSTPDGVAER